MEKTLLEHIDHGTKIRSHISPNIVLKLINQGYTVRYTRYNGFVAPTRGIEFEPKYWEGKPPSLLKSALSRFRKEYPAKDFIASEWTIDS